MPWPTTSRHARGYGKAWDALRAVILKRDAYLCQPCRKSGRITPARQVDHIIPKVRGGTDAASNLQAICARCHEEKTVRETGKQTRPRFGPDGNPIE